MTELYQQLVDLYAARELDEAAEHRLEELALENPELSRDMAALRNTVDALHHTPAPEFSEATSTRVLLLMQMRGATLPEAASAPEWQYSLPLAP